METNQSVSHSSLEKTPVEPQALWKQRLVIAGISLLFLIILAGMILAIISMVRAPAQTLFSWLLSP
jgi:hypothetical protein